MNIFSATFSICECVSVIFNIFFRQCVQKGSKTQPKYMNNFYKFYKLLQIRPVGRSSCAILPTLLAVCCHIFLLVIDSYHKHAANYRSAWWLSACTFLSFVKVSAQKPCAPRAGNPARWLDNAGFSTSCGIPGITRAQSEYRLHNQPDLRGGKTHVDDGGI